MMNKTHLMCYPLLTQLSAAVFSNDIDLAREILAETLFSRYEPGVFEAIIKGKQLANPQSLPPLSNGTNLDDCIRDYGLHNG